MKYPDDFINKVIQGDCLEVMKQMPDKCVDLVLTDPPYGLGQVSGTTSIKRGKNIYDVYDDSLENFQSVVIPAIHECLRIAHRVIVTPGSANLFKYPQPAAIGCMYQPAAVGRNKWGFADMQPILYYGLDPRRGKGSTRNSFQVTERIERHDHPCIKPLEFWRKLLEKGSLEGELVFDPFLGSGTTAVACKQLGRKYIGTELSQKYCDIANERLKQDLLF